MQIEPQISFRNVERNESIDRKIMDGIDKLGAVHEKITSVRMAVEDQRGNGSPDHLYRVRLDITIPRGEIVVKETPAGGRHLPLDQVLAQAFESARRKLKEVKMQRRGKVKDKVPRSRGG